MKHATLIRPALSHEAASLIAQLTLRSTIPAAELETLRDLLQSHPPRRVLGALYQAWRDQEAAGGPDWPRRPADQDSWLQLLDGLHALTQVEHTHLLAA